MTHFATLTGGSSMRWMRVAVVLGLCTLAVGCLDFDVFRTEPDPSSSASSGGGAGGEGGVGGATSSSTASSTSSGGGMGGAGGGGLQPCGGFIDDFDGMAALDWDVQAGMFSNDAAVATPPNSSFALNETKGAVLSNCYAQVEVTQDSDGFPFVGWLAAGSPQRFLKFITNGSDQVFVQLSSDMGPASDLQVMNAAPFTTGFVRIKEEAGNYTVETGSGSQGPWTVRVSFPAAGAPTWLSSPGRIFFGVEGNGTMAEFDNFNTP